MIQKNFEVRKETLEAFENTRVLLGLKNYEAIDQALIDWVKLNGKEAQKRLDAYTQNGLIIGKGAKIEINIAVFQKAEVLLAKNDLSQKLDLLQHATDPETKKEFQLTLARALKTVQPIYSKSRDPELTKLVVEAEAALT